MFRKLSIFFIALGLLLTVPGGASFAQQPTPPPPPRNLDDAAAPRAERLPAAALDTLRLAPSNLPDVSPGEMANWSKLAFQSYRNGQWDIFTARSNRSDEARLTVDGNHDIEPRWTRGLTRLAYVSRFPGNYEIYTMNPDGTGKTRLTNTPANEYNPSWSPDGTKIVFNSYRDGQSEIYVMNANGSGLTRLTNDPAYDGEPVWSPDGTKIAFTSTRGSGGYAAIWVMAPDGHGPSQVAGGESPAWSPDQQHLATAGDWDSDGWYELHVVNADGSYDWEMISLGGGYGVDILPRSWSPDGRYVAYTRIQYIYYYGNWYWLAAYLEAFDVVNRTTFRLTNGTEEWRPDWQTSDLQKPTSQVASLSSPAASPIAVSWSGADAGPSGVYGYDIQVRDGADGAWTTWLTRTTATTANYPGIGGHTYYFRSRAWDNSSNIENWPAVPDTSVTVEALPPNSDLSPLPAYQRGSLAVSWSGADPGGSGIANYDVQYQDSITGTWTDWQSATPATSAQFDGSVGHAYAFRVRATDRAQNVGAWSEPPEVLTTVYSRLVDGVVYDNRDRRIVGAEVQLVPAALNTIAATLHGYLGFLDADGARTLTVTHPLFGMAPPMTVALTADTTIDHWLPPLDNAVQNGDFEADGNSLPDWLSSGPITPTVVAEGHTGSRSAQLETQLEPQWSDAEIVPGHGPADMGVDASGVVHVVYEESGSIVYVQRDSSGVWLTPTVVVASGSQATLAVSPAGEAHLAWVGADGVRYRQRAANGQWSAPVLIHTLGRAPQIAVGNVAPYRPQVVSLWSNEDFLIKQDANRQWLAPQHIWTSVWVAEALLAPRLVIQGNDVARILIGDGSGPQICLPETVAYNCGYLPSPPGMQRLTLGPNERSHFLAWSTPWWTPAAVYGREVNGAQYAIEAIPDYAGNGDLAIDQHDTAYVVNVDAGALWLRYRALDAGWSTPRRVASGAQGTPRLIVDANDVMHVLYATAAGLEYRQSLAQSTETVTTISQVLALSGDLARATVSFFYQLQSTRTNETGQFTVVVDDGVSLTPVFTTTQPQSVWAHRWADVSRWAGQTITLELTLRETAYPAASQLRLDEISVGSWLTPDPQMIAPSRIDAGAASVITITGDNFIAPVKVKLDDTPLPDAHWIATGTITATVPGLPFGRYDVIVTNAGGQSSGLPGALLAGHEVLLPVIFR